MVIDEIDYKQRSPVAPDESVASNDERWMKRLASPMDRLAAWVADLVIFVPVLTLVVAPLRRIATEAQMIGNEQAWLVALLSIGTVSALMLVIYHALFLFLWGATPGKKMFSLKVVPIWNVHERIRPLTGLVRALTFIFEVLCFGVPLLGVFGNERRRALHDRVSDTVVITLRKKRAAGRASLSEVSMANGFLLAFFVSVTLVCAGQLIHQYRAHDDESDRQFARLEDSGSLCKQVGRSARAWVPNQGEAKPSRLTVALTLFAATEIDAECLGTEADYALWHRQSEKNKNAAESGIAEANLARGLSEAENSPQSEVYLKKVCEDDQESDACRVVRLMDLVDRSNTDDESNPVDVAADEATDEPTAAAERDQATALVVQQVTEKSKPYLQVWLSEYLMQTGQYAKALTIVDHLSHEETLAHFVLSARGQALWHVGDLAAARVVIRSAIDSSGLDGRIESARWLCQAETSNAGCSGESAKACSLLAAAVDQSSEVLAHDEVLVAYLRGEQCRTGGLSEKRLTEIEHLTPSVQAHDYINGLKLLAQNQKSDSFSVFEKLSHKSELGPFAVEASSEMIDLADSPERLKFVQKIWRESNPNDDTWQSLGQKLVEKFNSLGAWDHAVEVGLKMADAQALNLRSKKAVIVAAFRSGQTKLASGLLATLNAKPIESDADHFTSRQPASVTEFEDVARALSDPSRPRVHK